MTAGRRCAICNGLPNDDFDVGEVYWHIDCYTEGKFESHVVPVINAAIEDSVKAQRERLEAFLAERAKPDRETALKLAVENVLALDPNATSDPQGFKDKVAATFKRITGVN